MVDLKSKNATVLNDKAVSKLAQHSSDIKTLCLQVHRRYRTAWYSLHQCFRNKPNSALCEVRDQLVCISGISEGVRGQSSGGELWPLFSCAEFGTFVGHNYHI